MCGIIGGIAQRSVVPVLMEGLRRLEYRGYDSAGIAVIHNGLHRVRRIGRVAELAAAAKAADAFGHVGIAHTRWATHGAPSEQNAHPHISHDSIAVVHNGIVENHEELRSRLTGMGYTFMSETDTEVIAHLIHACRARSGSLLQAVQEAVAELRGTYAIGVISSDHPQQLVTARKGSPLLIGLGIEEHFIASDVAALLPVTQRVVHLEDGDVADIGLLGFKVYDRNGMRVERLVQTSQVRIEQSELGNYRHFMQKEIHEQPHALAKTLQSVLAAGRLDAVAIFGPKAGESLAKVNRVYIVACGTSFHAGAVARYWLEDLAGIPCAVEVASEYRYRNSVPDPNALIVTISQSGETADTVAALQHAKALGHPHTLAICNVAESALVRMSDLSFLTQAGPEIGVASTKAFTTQLAALLVLALVLAKQRGRLDAAQEATYLEQLSCLPGQASQTLALEPEIEQWAECLVDKAHALFLGRGAHYPIAMEGALKLKEISYIHAEAYPAGELKHGPLALVDSDMPVITIAPNNGLLEKLKSNLQEVRARDGEPFVIADQETEIADKGLKVIRLPAHAKVLSPVLHSIPLQLLAYHVALQKGTDVDKPRNLAKSVTVE